MTAMLPTRFDKAIGKAKVSHLQLVDHKHDARPAERVHYPYHDQMCWKQLCVTTGVNWSTFWYRVNRYGMTPLQALTSHIEPYRHIVMSDADLCRRVGINRATFTSRRKCGWSYRDALLTPARPRRPNRKEA